MEGWCKPSKAARYAGVTVKTFRSWLRDGLKHARLPSGRILVKYKDIDAYLSRFATTTNEIDRAVDEVLRGL